MHSLYIHVPFCAEKCDYCDFYSETAASTDIRRQYLLRLDEELAIRSHGAAPLETIYIGGGTPTSLRADELAGLLQHIHRHFETASGVEFSIEANPGSLDVAKIATLAAHGVNRISIGVQSFAQRQRQTLGRKGELSGLNSNLQELRRSGFRNIGIDLIYGIPGQTLDDWLEDLQRCLELQPTHVSTYCLSLEPGTPLTHQNPTPIPDELAIEMWEAAAEVLGRQGLTRYEISNFSQATYACRHNLEIWYGATFMAAGPAAHWFDGTTRWGNPADLQGWLANQPAEPDWIPSEMRAREILITGLRVCAGWDRQQFQEATAFDYEYLCGSELDMLRADGLLTAQYSHLAATPKGLLLADYVAGNLLVDTPSSANEPVARYVRNTEICSPE